MPSDLLIMYDNAIDRAGLAATHTTGTAVAANLGNDIKGKIHRSGFNGSVGYLASWAVDQTIGAVAIPMSNVYSTATMQINLYSNNNFTGSVYSTPITNVFQYSDISNWNGYSGSATANEFSTGRYSTGYFILPSNYSNIKSMRVTVASDTSGARIDTSRLVAGRAWRPNRYASNGVQLTTEDNPVVTKTTSGNFVIDRGFQSNNLNFDIKYMDETDRTELFKILKLVGSTKNVFVSIFPSTTSRLRDDYAVYGRVIRSPITYALYNLYDYTVSIEGW